MQFRGSCCLLCIGLSQLGCSGEAQSTSSNMAGQPRAGSDVGCKRMSTGYLLFTDDRQLVRFDIATRQRQVEWVAPGPLRYAQPLGQSRKYVVVYRPVNDKADRVLYVDTSGPRARWEEWTTRARIGLPSVSPDGARVAWVASSPTGSPILEVWGLAERKCLWKCEGDFRADSSGPAWVSLLDGKTALVVASQAYVLMQVGFGTGVARELCPGGYPAAIPNEAAVVFIQGEWLCRIGLEPCADGRRVVQISNITDFYQGCSVSQDGQYAAVTELVPMPHALSKRRPAVSIVHVNSGAKESVPTGGLAGPWAWVGASRAASSQPTRKEVDRSSREKGEG